MIKRLLPLLGLLGCLWAGRAEALCTLPYILQNGTIPNATQVMANFYALLNCINSGGGGSSGTVTSLTAGACITLTPNPTTTTGTVAVTAPLLVTCGGTQRASLTDHTVLIGAGTAPVNFATPGTTGFVLTSTGASSDPTFQAPVGTVLINCNADHDALQSTAPSTFTCITDYAQFDKNQTWTLNQAMGPEILTDGATINTDGLNRNYYKVTLTGNNHTLATPTNIRPGNYTWFIFTGAGFTGFATSADFKFVGGTPTWSTAAGKEDIISCLVDDTLVLACFAGLDAGGAGGGLSLNSAQLFVGNGSNVATGVALSGVIGITNAGVTSFSSSTGSGATVLATSPSISGLTVSGSFTATGLVTNADLANPATTVNGQTCTLGSTCTITAAATGIVVGTTTIGSGSSGFFLYNNAGTLGNKTIACADLSDDGTACTASTGTSGTTLPFLDGTNTFSGVQAFGEVHGTTETVTLASNNYNAVVADCGKVKLLPTGTTPTVTLPNISPASGSCTITFITTVTKAYLFNAAAGGSKQNSQGFYTSRGTAAGDTVSVTLITPSVSAAVWNVAGDLTS